MVIRAVCVTMVAFLTVSVRESHAQAPPQQIITGFASRTVNCFDAEQSAKALTCSRDDFTFNQTAPVSSAGGRFRVAANDGRVFWIGSADANLAQPAATLAPPQGGNAAARGQRASAEPAATPYPFLTQNISAVAPPKCAKPLGSVALVKPDLTTVAPDEKNALLQRVEFDRQLIAESNCFTLPTGSATKTDYLFADTSRSSANGTMVSYALTDATSGQTVASSPIYWAQASNDTTGSFGSFGTLGGLLSRGSQSAAIVGAIGTAPAEADRSRLATSAYADLLARLVAADPKTPPPATAPAAASAAATAPPTQ